MIDGNNKILVINENKYVIAAIIIPFSIAGVLVRIALTRLETYPGSPVFGLVYAQWVGCFIMGIVVINKPLLFKWYYPLHAALSTGLCGSITTFSSWQLQIFKEFANYDAHPHTRGKNILAALSVFLVTMAMSWQSLLFGQHVGKLLIKRCNVPEIKVTPRGFTTSYLYSQDYGVILLGLLSWIGVLMAAIFTRTELALACVFAPAGALLRWILSFYNASFFDKFFMGTFVANIIGTIILSVIVLLQSGAVSLTVINCDILQALADGFCGCLTTISTFMVELNTLSLLDSYIYGSSSIVIAQCFVFVILGSFVWSQGVDPPTACSSA
ncbi:hypothetical protein G6F37_001048 [Rhizopus arrhizus]|nr:hypothetical protein G6F38_000674 [Rhizopus arrhizus]KAG1163598.1 hypothetical protein G6F37_001048 [Rhizopus arrhizus]